MILKKTFKVLFSFMLFVCASFLNAGDVQLQASYTIDSDWGTGYDATVTITNNSGYDVSDWTVVFDLPSGQAISSLWNGSYTTSGSQVTVTNVSWNGSLAAGSSTTVGFGASNTGANPAGLQFVSATGTSSSSPTDTSFVLDSSFSVPSSWDGGFFAVIKLENNQTTTANFWSVEFDLPTGSQSIQDMWGATYQLSNLHATLANPQCTDETTIAPGASLSIAMIVLTNSGVTPDLQNLQAVANGPFDTSTSQPPLQPAIKATTPSAGSFVLSWGPTQAASYTLSESSASDMSSAKEIYSGTSYSYNVQAKPAGTYYYQIKATNTEGLSSLSNILTVTVPDTTTTDPVSPAAHKIVGYFASWDIYHTPAVEPKDINGSLLTHINYAFSKVDTSGNIALVDPWADIQYGEIWSETEPFWGNFKQLNDLKAKYPGLKTIISIGGWTLSDTFPQLAASSTARENFANQCVSFCQQYGFDGVDIDWEYPCFAQHGGTPADKANFTLLLQELNSKLKAASPELILTFAAPAGPSNYVNIELDQVHQYVDWINLMTYDFHGPWGGTEDSVTNHLAAIDSPAQGDSRLCCSEAVQYYLNQGVPADKIVMGIPFYGRTYAQVQSSTNGLYDSYSGAGTGTFATGVMTYSDITQNQLPNYQSFWDSSAEYAYLFRTDIKQFVSWESDQSMRLKSSYIQNLGLGGAMFWELGLDVVPGWDALHILYDSLNAQTSTQ